MCNLYANTTPQSEMRRLFDVAPAGDRLGNAAPQPAVFPKDTAPIVRRHEDGRRELCPMQWGFLLPQVSKRTGHPIQPKPVTNARDDKLRASPFWRESFETRRCLVPASAFCEPKGRKPAVHYWFGMAAADEEVRPPFAFAGIWRRWRGEIDGEAVDLAVYAIVTTRPNPLVAQVHPDRMPVILEAGEHADWLDGTPDAAANLLRPLPQQRMRIVRQGAGLTADRG